MVIERRLAGRMGRTVDLNGQELRQSKVAGSGESQKLNWRCWVNRDSYANNNKNG